MDKKTHNLIAGDFNHQNNRQHGPAKQIDLLWLLFLNYFYIFLYFTFSYIMHESRKLRNDD